MSDLVTKVREAVEQAKLETGRGGSFGELGTGSTIQKARTQLAQAHLEQALKVLTDNV